MAPLHDKKRKRGIEAEGYRALYTKYAKVEPEHFAEAFPNLLCEMGVLSERIGKPEILSSLHADSLELWEALKMFELKEMDTSFWKEIKEEPVPPYLLESINRTQSIGAYGYRGNEGFPRAIIDQILTSAIYEENDGNRKRSKSPKTTSTTEPSREKTKDREEPIMLQLRRETPIQKKVIYQGTPRLLTGFADYTVWYDSQGKTTLATNFIIVEGKQAGYFDTCLGQLAAYMGAIHSLRKEEGKENAAVFGVATDGLVYRFCRIDKGGDWSQCPIRQWYPGLEGELYSTFKTLIRIAALSSPSTSLIENPTKRQKVLVAFRTPSRTQKCEFSLKDIEIIEEDSETEIEWVSWSDTKKENLQEP